MGAGTGWGGARRWRPTPLPLTDGRRAPGYAAPADGRAGLGGRRGVSERPTAVRWRVLVERQGRAAPGNMGTDQGLVGESGPTGWGFPRPGCVGPRRVSFGAHQ